MTDLQRKALASLPLSAEEVQDHFDEAYTHVHPQFVPAARLVRALCVSHERLRAEVQGAEVLPAEAGYLGRRWCGEPNSVRGDSFGLVGATR